MTNQATPFGDVNAMMSQFKVPGIDMTAIVEARRKDIEALVEANSASFAALQAMAAKQTEMLSEAMQGMQDAAKNWSPGGTGMADSGQQADAVRKGFERTLANMKELADMARHAQSDAMSRITQRAAHQMQDIKASMTPK